MCIFLFLLSGCSLNRDYEVYVDLDSAQHKIEENKLDIQTNNFLYDDKPYNIMKITSTIDGDYYYSFQTPNTKINLQSGRIQNICQIPGCAHNYISPNCINYQNFISPVATSRGIYYIDENRVMLLNENTEENAPSGITFNSGRIPLFPYFALFIRC